MTRSTRRRTALTGACAALVAGALTASMAAAPAEAGTRSASTSTSTSTPVSAPASLRANPTVYVNQPLTITGKAGRGKRKVQVQQKLGPTWVKTGKGKTDKKGRYSVSVPTDVYGRHKVRVVAPRSKGKRAVTGKAKKYTVIPVYSPVGSASSYVLYDSSNRTRWNSCKPITWSYNAGGTDAAHRAVVDAAIAEASRATGWRFKYVGETTKVPFTYKLRSQRSEPSNIVIAWSTEATLPILAGSVAGYGGSTLAYRSRSGTGEVTNGGVTLDSTLTLPLVEYGDGTVPSWAAIVRHELGHVVGLDHTQDASQIMYPASTGANEYYGAGDLRGLALASKSRGCSGSSIRKVLGAGGRNRDLSPARLRTLGLVPFQGSGPIS